MATSIGNMMTNHQNLGYIIFRQTHFSKKGPRESLKKFSDHQGLPHRIARTGHFFESSWSSHPWTGKSGRRAKSLFDLQLLWEFNLATLAKLKELCWGDDTEAGCHGQMLTWCPSLNFRMALFKTVFEAHLWRLAVKITGTKSEFTSHLYTKCPSILPQTNLTKLEAMCFPA